MAKIKNLAYAGVAIFFMFLSRNALAICKSNNYEYSYEIPSTILSVPQNQPLGPIGNVIDVAGGVGVTIDCSGGTATTEWITLLTLNNIMQPSTYSPDIFKTNVPGIGIRIWNDYRPNDVVVLSNHLKRWYHLETGPSVGREHRLVNIKIQFYVIGPVSPGVIQLPSPFVSAWVNDKISTSGGSNYNTLHIPSQIKVVVPTCETSDLTVKMGKHDTDEFTGKNSTSNEIPFSFGIKNCSSLLKSISYMLEAGPGINVMHSGTDNQYLTLNALSDARGVGIQVLDSNGKPATFNQKIKINTGETVLPAYNIPMKARYIKMDDKITGGVANSSMIVTMSYE